MVISVAVELLVVLGLGVPFFVFERWFAAHPVSYRRVLARDVCALVLAVILGVPAGALVNVALGQLAMRGLLPQVPALPPWASIPLGVLASDFAFYWTHRLVHTRPLWRVHRWHHSPRHMYWLAGARASALQGLLYGVAQLSLVALSVPPYALAGYAVLAIVGNHWMHANLRFRSRWLEAVLVTPRIHHVHHSRDPRHHDRNFGSILCVWDRMFGTYLDPDEAGSPLEFGIREKVSRARMVVGV